MAACNSLASNPGSALRRRKARPAAQALLLAVLAIILPALPNPAHALVRFDFEQKYFRHPGRQVWDFSIIRADDTYHIYYHSIPEAAPGAANGDTIWHATSADLARWDVQGPALVTADAAAWEQGAHWAPAVARDEDNERWVMLYTGVDARMNQLIGLAESPDLATWTRLGPGPAIAPDTTAYIWSAASYWSDFRDPYLWREDGLWHVLVTARSLVGGAARGVLFHASSPDLATWTDLGPVFTNDGATPGRVLESPQYHVIGAWHHLLFGEFDTTGVTILSAAAPGTWTMSTRRMLDAGFAPEVASFDPGVNIYARLAPFQLPQGAGIAYVVRIDTLRTAADGSAPYVWLPHPLAADWEVRSGTATLGNPIFGDNPLYRAEPSSGLVGNGYFGSREYYPGPLSGRGAPGAMLGDSVTGRLESRPFVVTGHRMRLLVGGGDFPNTCYVALVDAADGTVLHSESGQGQATMTPREWDLTGDRGRLCRLVIVDQESAPGGHINVDEIEELDAGTAAAPPAGHAAHALTIAPNPANPSARITFEAGAGVATTVSVYDVAGRRVWTSGPLRLPAGAATVTWPGLATDGSAAPSGAYLVRVDDGSGPPRAGRLVLVK